MNHHIKTWTPRLLFFTALLILDQWTKHLVLAAVERGDLRPFWQIRGILEIIYAENTGMAFGLFPGGGWFFFTIAIITIAAIGFFLVKGYVRSQWGVWGLIAIAAGGLSNAIDRLLHGFVVDMINPTFINFFVFNFADVFIVCGGIAFAIYLIFFYEKEQQVRKKTSEIYIEK